MKGKLKTHIVDGWSLKFYIVNEDKFGTFPVMSILKLTSEWTFDVVLLAFCSTEVVDWLRREASDVL